jgi:methyl-accepting chemotaxis protein
MKNGVELAAEGEVAFSAIVKYVSEIRTINENIAQGSQEQSQGVEQITKAMSTIDTTSQENAKTSQDLESTAALVKSEADRLNEIVLELKQVIHGNVNKKSSGVPNESEDSMTTMKSA